MVTEIAGLFTTAVDTYVSTPKYRDQVKGHDDGGKVINSGLNNIMVAIPQLFDIMENLAADKYGVSRMHGHIATRARLLRIQTAQ